MKATFFFKIALMSAFALGAMTVVSCSKDKPEPKPYADYFGTWKYEFAGGWGQVTLSADELIFVDNNGDGFTLVDLTWTPKTNSAGAHITTYPTGYKITGKLTADKRFGPLKADGTVANIGDIAVDYWYISTDKMSLRWGAMYTSDHEANAGPYVKQ